MRKIEEYVNSLIPEKISTIKQILIKDELLSHIFERVEFYEEIGYSHEISVNKAIDDMGNDENIKNAVKQHFYDLHVERTWWAFAVSIAVVLIGLINLFTYNFVALIQYSDDPHWLQVVFSLLSLFIQIFMFKYFCYNGYRKCLMALGVANLLCGLSLFLSVYPQCAIYAIGTAIDCFVDKFTPFYFEGFYMLGGVYSSVFVLLVFSVCCIVKSTKIKKGNIKSRKSGLIITSMVLCLLTVLIPVFYEKSNNYFDISDWKFGTDCRNYITDEVFEDIEDNMDYDEVIDYLNTETYASSTAYKYGWFNGKLPIKIKEKLENRSYIPQIEGYDIWASKKDMEKIKAYGDDLFGNGLIFTKTDGNGKLIGKGVGNAFLDVFTCSNGVNDADLSIIYEKFMSIEIGDKEEITEFFNENAVPQTYIVETTPDGKIAYYRFSVTGFDMDDILKTGSHYKTLYFEFSFVNGKLTDGRLHYKIDKEQHCINITSNN